MREIRSAARMQRLALQWRARGERVGFVPTMGYLHAGHLSLVHAARRRVGPRGKVVVSIYVNPTQFAPHEDLARYPRDLPRDRQLCRLAGVDCLFVPEDREMYHRPGRCESSTYVVEEALSRGMEGASRPTHFRGVATVVAKLFNLVQPHVAVFGAKDYQQAAVVMRMTRDLNFPVRVIVAPTVREPDGVAMSSRNQYLDAEERRGARVLSRALQALGRRVGSARRPIPAGTLRREVEARVGEVRGARLDYVAFFDPETLTPVSSVRPGTHAALAVFMGRTRLIDNARL